MNRWINYLDDNSRFTIIQSSVSIGQNDDDDDDSSVSSVELHSFSPAKFPRNFNSNAEGFVSVKMFGDGDGADDLPLQKVNTFNLHSLRFPK